MKKRIIIMCAIFWIAAFSAQVSNKINDVSSKADQTSTSVGNAGNSIENASSAVNKVFQAGKNIFKGKKKNSEESENITGSYQMIIKNVDYDNPYFGQISTAIKSTKGISSIKKSIDDNVGSFTFNYQGDISEIWDGMDSKLRQHFKVEKLTSDSIILINKDK